MELEATIGILAGIFTTVAILPQIFKAFKTGKVESISPFFFIIMLTGLILWTVHGIFKLDWPIILTNAVSAILNSTMLIIYYKNKSSDYKN